MNPELQQLLDIVDQAYNRKSWHGTNLRGSIRGLTPAQASWRPAPGRHNIHELIVHAAYWKYAAWRRWGDTPAGGYGLVLGRPHAWTYRGQVLPTDREVTVLLEVTAADDAARRLTANGFLTVDGRVIYQMTDFTLE